MLRNPNHADDGGCAALRRATEPLEMTRPCRRVPARTGVRHLHRPHAARVTHHTSSESRRASAAPPPRLPGGARPQPPGPRVRRRGPGRPPKWGQHGPSPGRRLGPHDLGPLLLGPLLMDHRRRLDHEAWGQLDRVERARPRPGADVSRSPSAPAAHALGWPPVLLSTHQGRSTPEPPCAPAPFSPA